MKKLIIIGPSLKMGGMEQASVNVANAMVEHYEKVVFLSIFKQVHFFKLNPKIELIEPIGFNVFNLSILKTIKLIRRSIKEILPDHIIVYNKFYSAIALLSLIGLKQSVFISERSSPLYKWPRSQSLICDIVFSLLKPKGIIAQTKIASKIQSKYYGSRIPIKVIPNTLREVNTYPQIQREKIILAVGRLNDPLKGFDQLLNAFAMIQNLDWELHIAGGELEEDKLLYSIVKEKNLFKRVKFLGKVKDIDKVYAEAGIFIIPSRSEGFPNALCEAMAAGLPCISFDFIAGPSDIIKDGINGILVENGNILKLTKSIDVLIEDNNLRNKISIEAKKIRLKLCSNIIERQIVNFLNK